MGLDSGLLDAVASLSLQERRLEAVTANLANVSTTAYKRRESAVRSFRATLSQAEPLPYARAVVNHTQGPLEQTGRTLDLALEGDGFFVVEGSRGELLTRDGHFRLDAAGALVTAEGLPVAWVGTRGYLDPAGEPIVVDEGAQVFQGGTRLGQLKVVEYADPTRLEDNGPGLFRSPGMLDRPATGAVHQGALEGSNTSSMDELVELVTIQRQYESAAKLLSTIDRSFQRLNQAR